MSEAIPTPPPNPPAPQRRSAPIVLLLLVALSLIGVVWWINHTRSPEYQARMRLEEAKRAAEQGNLTEAAKLFFEVGHTATPSARPAGDAFKALFHEPLDRATLETANGLFRLALEWNDREDIAEGLLLRGMERIKARGDDEPHAALQLLELLGALSTGQEDVQNLYRDQLGRLQRWSDKYPDDLALAIALANARGLQFDLAGVVKVLEPRLAKLGTGDGARLLGQAYARLGKTEEALDLLEPYCAHNVQKFVEIEPRFQKALETAARAAATQVDERKAERFDFAAYDQAPEEVQRVQKEQYARSRASADPEVKKLFAAYRLHGMVVEALKDLVQAYMVRASTRTDPSPRLADLKKAEEASRSLGGTSGNQPDLRSLYVRVAFLMGQRDEGYRRLNEFLDGYRRHPSAMMVGADVLRTASDLPGARKLAEEAHAGFEANRDERNRQNTAFTRSRLSGDDADDQIVWLGKCDTKNPQIALALLIAQGRRARRAGREAEAATHYRKAIEAMASGADGPAKDHELGRGWLALFQVTGDRSALTTGLGLVEKAIAAAPNNVELLTSSMVHLQVVAWRDLILDAIDVLALRAEAGQEHLVFLFSDRAGREEQATRLRKHPAMLKARADAEKLLALAPAQPQPYRFLASLYLMDRDTTRLKTLAEALHKAAIDHGDTLQQRLDVHAGKVNEHAKKDRQTLITRWEERLPELRKKPQGRTLAVALTSLGRHLLLGEALGESPDADRLVKLAEEARAACDCRGTADQLVAVLLHRAHRQLIEKDPEYRKLADRVRHAVDASDLLALALTRGGDTAKLAQAHPDVVRACNLVKEWAIAFPDSPTGWSWAVLSRMHPEVAAKVAEELRTDEANQLNRAIGLQLSPLHLSKSLEAYWAAQAAGKNKEGKELLRRLAGQGVLLPIDLD